MNIAWTGWQRTKQHVGWGLLAAWIWANSAAAQNIPESPPMEETHLAQECAALLQTNSAWRAWQIAKVVMQSQGMRLVLQACPFVRVGVGRMQQVLDVRVHVTDSDTAAQFVRGPLADGEAVDMGVVHIEPAHDEEVSPDVQFNRDWLAQVMQKRGLAPVEGHWWAFVPQENAK